MGKSYSITLSKNNFCYQLGVISFSLVVRHLNSTYMLTIKIYYFVFVPCYYTLDKYN